MNILDVVSVDVRWSVDTGGFIDGIEENVVKLNMYAIYDRCSGVYDRPFPSHGDNSAIRAFHDNAANPQGFIGKYAEDFTLFRIGTWEDDKGELVGHAPEKVIGAHEILAQFGKRPLEESEDAAPS